MTRFLTFSLHRSFRFAVAASALLAAVAACTHSGPEKPKPDNSGAYVLERHSPAALARSRHRIDSLEARIKEAVKSPEKAPDVRLAMYTIKAYQYFVADFPQDPRAPAALDRAAQLWSGVLGDHQKAVEYYEKAYQNYPDYKNRPQMLLQEGLAAEAAHDTASAAIAYQRMIAAYPQHPFTEQARSLLRVLRMSDAEKHKRFMEAK